MDSIISHLNPEQQSIAGELYEMAGNFDALCWKARMAGLSKDQIRDFFDAEMTIEETYNLDPVKVEKEKQQLKEEAREWYAAHPEVIARGLNLLTKAVNAEKNEH